MGGIVGEKWNCGDQKEVMIKKFNNYAIYILSKLIEYFNCCLMLWVFG